MKRILISFLLPCFLAAQTASFPGAVVTDAELLVGRDRADSTLTAQIDASTLTIPVASGTRFGANMLVTIDSEQIKICSVASNTLTACSGGRGFNGTTAATHASDASVRGQIGGYYHNALSEEMQAVQAALGAKFRNLGIWATQYDFAAQAPGGTLSAGVGASVTLTPCPTGVAGANTNHYLYVSGGTGTAEPVLITGGTCTSDATTGTVQFTPANAHSGAWTVASATAGIQEAFYSSSDPMQVILDEGTITMRGKLSFPRDSISLVGQGFSASKLTWPSDLADDLISVDGGGGGSYRRGVHLEKFAIYSTVQQTAGAAIHLYSTTWSVLRDLKIQGDDSVSTLYHGVWFDEVDNVHMDHVEAVADNDAVRVNGTVGAGAKAGLYIHNSRLLNSTVGIRVGGGFGGLYVTQADIIANGTGLLLDQTLAAESNREIFLDGTTTIDSSTSIGIDINEGFNNGYLGLSGTWVSANVTGMRVRTGTAASASINIAGGTFFNNSTVGILNESTVALWNVTGTAFRSNATAINQSVTSGFYVRGLRFDSNTTDITGTVYSVENANVSWPHTTERQLFLEMGNVAGTDTTGGETLWIGAGENGIATAEGEISESGTIKGAAAVGFRGFAEGGQYQGAMEFWTKQSGTAYRRFMVPSDGGIRVETAGKPSCDADHGGNIHYVAGGAGVADTFEACRKDASDNYAWVSILP
jgi:hypothetical protein